MNATMYKKILSPSHSFVCMKGCCCTLNFLIFLYLEKTSNSKIKWCIIIPLGDFMKSKQNLTTDNEMDLKLAVERTFTENMRR